MRKLLECEYIEALWQGKSWKEQKKELQQRYEKKYEGKTIIITRVKSDTKGLRCYIVEEEL